MAWSNLLTACGLLHSLPALDSPWDASGCALSHIYNKNLTLHHTLGADMPSLYTVRLANFMYLYFIIIKAYFKRNKLELSLCQWHCRFVLHI